MVIRPLCYALVPPSHRRIFHASAASMLLPEKAVKQGPAPTCPRPEAAADEAHRQLGGAQLVLAGTALAQRHAQPFPAEQLQQALQRQQAARTGPQGVRPAASAAGHRSNSPPNRRRAERLWLTGPGQPARRTECETHSPAPPRHSSCKQAPNRLVVKVKASPAALTCTMGSTLPGSLSTALLLLKAERAQRLACCPAWPATTAPQEAGGIRSRGAAMAQAC